MDEKKYLIIGGIATGSDVFVHPIFTGADVYHGKADVQ